MGCLLVREMEGVELFLSANLNHLFSAFCFSNSSFFVAKYNEAEPFTLPLKF